MERGRIGEAEVQELAISLHYPSVSVVNDVGSGNKCVCVIGSSKRRFPDSNVEAEEEEGDSSMGRWWVQFFLAEGSIPRNDMSTVLQRASNGVALDLECVSVDRAGILAVHKPFKQVKMDVDDSSFTFVVAPDGTPSIYCLGGVVKPKGPGEEFVDSRDVRIFNFNTATYTSGPSMEVPRVSPAVLFLDGKIFVFGGVQYLNPRAYPGISWAESLDLITTNTSTDTRPWKPLHQPPVFLDCRGAFALGVDDGQDIFFGTKEEIKEEKEKEVEEGRVSSGGGGGGKAILLGSTLDRVFLVYHLREDRWIRLPNKIPISFWDSRPVAVGHTLYWVGSYFYAHDFRTGELFSGLVRGLENYLNDRLRELRNIQEYKPGLHHLGGDDFCLTWLDWVNVISCSFTRLHSTVIRVVMSTDGSGRLDAFVTSSTSHLLPHGFYFEHSLLLDGLVCNHTIVKEGVSSGTLTPFCRDESSGVKKNAEARSDYEGATKEKIEDNAGIGLQGLLIPTQRPSPGLLLRYG